jgi:hypothetical protein
MTALAFVSALFAAYFPIGLLLFRRWFRLHG